VRKSVETHIPQRPKKPRRPWISDRTMELMKFRTAFAAAGAERDAAENGGCPQGSWLPRVGAVRAMASRTYSGDLAPGL